MPESELPASLNGPVDYKRRDIFSAVDGLAAAKVLQLH
jgi:hypothetical protein